MISWNYPTILFLATSCFVVAACSESDDTDTMTPEPPIETKTTWHNDIAPLVHEKCVGCHQSEGGIAPFGLETFEEAGPIANFMLSNIESGVMPPWGAVDNAECAPEHDWKKDARLSETQLELFQSWVSDGAPEGDENTKAPLPSQSPGFEELSGTTHSLVMEPYITEGFTDELRCFLLDPALLEAHYMTGVEIIPDNLEVAHHATLTVIPPAGVEEIRERVEPNGSFACTGGAGLEGAYSLGVWVPGTAPFETPIETGTPLAPGSLVMLQMHYHPTGFDHLADQTRVNLRLTKTSQTTSLLLYFLQPEGHRLLRHCHSHAFSINSLNT